MSWSRSSKLGLVLLSLLVLTASAGVASAVSVTDEQAPEEAEVGQEVTVTVELQDLYADHSSWELNGQTELQNAQWTIETYQGDTLLETYESSGSQPDPVAIDESDASPPDRVVVTITGTAPEVEEYSYEEPATFLAGEVVQVFDDGSDFTRLSELPAHHYTTGDPGSKEAREALDQASETIQSASGDTSEAESTFDDAVSAYNSEEFAEAVSLAEEAESQASSSDGGDGSTGDGSTDGDSSDGGSTDGASSDDGSGSTTGDTSGDDAAGNESASDSGDDGGLFWVLLYGVLGLLILGAVGGGIYWYQQQQQGPSRDPLG